MREGGSFWASPELAGRSVHTDPVPRDASLAGAVLAARRVEYIEDIQRDPRWRHRDLAERNDLHGCLALPLIHQGKAVGALIVAFGRRGGVTAEERDLAGLLADQAAIAIENARLYEDAGRRRREAELLTAVVRTINTSLDLETVLPRIAEGAREICRCDMAFIGLRDAALDTVVFRQWPGARHASYASCRIAPGQGAAGQVLATGRPFRTNSYLEDARIGPEFRAVVTAEGIRAYMVVGARRPKRSPSSAARSPRPWICSASCRSSSIAHARSSARSARRLRSLTRSRRAHPGSSSRAAA